MEYHKERFTDASLIVRDQENIRAILPANRVGDVLYSHQGLTYGGLVYHQLTLVQVIEVVADLLEYMHITGIRHFICKPIPDIYQHVPSSDLSYALFLAGAGLRSRETLSVVRNQDGLRLSTLRRRGLKKAEQRGLQVKEEAIFSDFWNSILIPNLRERHGVDPVHSLEEIEKLYALFPNNIRQFNVYKQGDLVAGTTIFESEQVAHAQYISVNHSREDGALDLLFTTLIGDVYRHKPYFDFGSSNEAGGSRLNVGLNHWKQSFGASTYIQDGYITDTSNYNDLRNALI